MSAHTPGPWIYDRHPDGFTISEEAEDPGRAEALAATPARSRWTGEVLTWLPPTETDEANARLMAAAPELADALEEAVPLLREIRSVADHWSARNEDAQAILELAATLLESAGIALGKARKRERGTVTNA